MAQRLYFSPAPGAGDRGPVWAAWLALAAVAGVFLFILALPHIWDIDIWWHLRAGEWIVGHRALPRTDVFSSVEPERSWKSFNWLFQVGAYGIHQAAGLLGVRVAAAGDRAGRLWALGRGLLPGYQGPGRHLFIDCASGLLFDDRISTRPHLFNMVGEGALLYFFAGDGLLRSRRSKVGYFLLFVVWANLHHPGAALVCLSWASPWGCAW